MPKQPVLAIIRALLAVGIVVYAYVAFVHVTTVDRPRIAQLAVRTTGISQLSKKPSSTQVLDITTSPFKTVLAAAKSNPFATGAYSTIWNAPPKIPASAVMVFDLLPTHAQALQVEAQGRSEFFSTKAFKQFIQETPLSLPGVPNFVGYRLYSAKTASSPKGQSIDILFTFQRVVVIDIISASIANVSQSLNFALAEYHKLLATEPGFVLTSETRPPVGSVFYFIGSALVVAFAFGGMTWIVEGRERREREKEAAVRRHYQVRGAKVLRGRQQGRSYRR